MDETAALEIVQENAGFLYQNRLREQRKPLEMGFALSSLWAEHPNYFPAAVVKYVEMGERTGKLHENIQCAAEYMEMRCQLVLKGIKQTLQPVLVLFAGAAVTLLLALVLPIINAATSFGGL